MPAKLLYILNGLGRGGVEIAFLSGLSKLRQKFDLKVIILGKPWDDMLAEIDEEDRECIHIIDRPVYLLPVTLSLVLRFAKKFKPDIVLSSLWRASLMGVAIKLIWPRTKFIAFIHNTCFFHLPDSIATQMAIKLSDAVFVDAIATRKFVEDRFSPKGKVHVISFITASSPAVFNRQINPEEGLKLMYLGRLHKVKNVPAAIEVVSYLKQQGIKVHFDIYGPDNGELEAVRTLIKESKLEEEVKLKGQLNNTQKFNTFEHYDGYLQLSTCEGMAMSVVEAMQNGLMCIVTPVGEIPNYSEDMVSAIQFNIENEELRAQSLDKLIAALKNKELCNNIAYNAYSGFRNKPLYKDSITACIREVYEAVELDEPVKLNDAEIKLKRVQSVYELHPADNVLE